MADTVRADARSRTLFLSGDLDMSSAPDLEAALAEADWLDIGPIRFDLSELTFIDSSGLKALISAYEVGRTLVFVSPTPVVRKVIELFGYDSLNGIRIEDPADV